MKKVFAALISVLILISVLVGCGASKSSYDSAKQNSIAASAPPPNLSVAREEMGMIAPAGSIIYDGAYDKESISSVITVQASSSVLEKIIYTADAHIETIDFDKSVSDVYSLLDMYGGFIENSFVGGANYYEKYYDYQTYRNARFTLRVPVDSFNALIDSLDKLGNVISRSSNAENITAQFTDNESRLAKYRTEETRLLAMLEKADTVADMITIETRLSEIRYQIETITSQLRNWQNQVDYSTVQLWINEVEKLSEQIPVKRSYWQQTGDGLMSTLKNVGRFFTDLFKWIIVSLPVLIILAAICVVVIILIRRSAKKRHKKLNAQSSEHNGENNDK